ncbi:ABC-type branched-chain amino acid transport system, permease component [Sphaerochaeta pleomorpha str. Grapes]|uniref:ABC-type branched-chain amino acid transport system, permease component n=1 Tax=Sphaerochaeta pleomorpha (strain ATCC BAA-1885 / DSM 22778 / Grapes) TaxID=158190 RepID=G8QXH5_SPHPG|nr:branched-chain amino acid ABC transporter permease [Sphaerochaeta pleomorpha]AEV29538.1 ABC-type branched-chain amino acid transport system, permease component [Sphaerochaeta pleomorpha str. Grapes]
MNMLADTKKRAKLIFDKHKVLYSLLLLAFLFVLPLVNNKSYVMGVMCRILMYATLAGALNIINGYSGQTCLGVAGFFCFGAYTEAILATKVGLSFWLCIPLAGIVTAIVGLVVAWPTLKMSGIYLAIVTLGFSEIARLLALNATPLTGGALGIKNIPVPELFGIVFKNSRSYYYLFLALAIVFIFVSNRVIKSKIGRAWMSIREDELASKSLGVNASVYKAFNFMYGAFWIGVVGCVYAPYVRFIDSTYFTLDEGWNILSMVILGGQGTFIGPVIGSIIVNFLTEVLRPIGQWRLVAFALLIIIMMWYRPQGLAGATDSKLAGNKMVGKLQDRGKKHA